MYKWMHTVYRFFWPVVTYEWCAITFNYEYWHPEHKKCYNGEPTGAGWFLTIVKLKGASEADAWKYCEEMNAAAKEVTEEIRKEKEKTPDGG